MITPGVFARLRARLVSVRVDEQERDPLLTIRPGELDQAGHVKVADRAFDPHEHEHHGRTALVGVERDRPARGIGEREVGHRAADPRVDRHRVGAKQPDADGHEHGHGEEAAPESSRAKPACSPRLHRSRSLADRRSGRNTCLYAENGTDFLHAEERARRLPHAHKADDYSR